MSEADHPESRSPGETAREFIYALPAGLVIFAHVLAAMRGSPA